MSNPLQASLLKCAAAGISVYSPHTSLDSAHGGVSDWLVSGLRWDGVADRAIGGREVNTGPGRFATLEKPLPLQSVVDSIKAHLGVERGMKSCQIYIVPPLERSGFILVQLASPPDAPLSSMIKTVALCAGSGGSVLGGEQADLYWTGEMTHVMKSRSPC
jgi:putative NIF3 family GTP cyclohydrolase 1 type 2